MPFSLQSNKTLILINFVLIHIIFLEKQPQTALVCKELQAKPVKATRETKPYPLIYTCMYQSGHYRHMTLAKYVTLSVKKEHPRTVLCL